MGGSRSTTEFDDETHRCPNASTLGAYTPSWTNLIRRFPEIPERTDLPNPGPDGNGGTYLRTTYDAKPA